MAGVLPPRSFKTSHLQIEIIPPGQRYGRIYLKKYIDPLGFGKSPSRFSDPRELPEARRFGVLYIGEIFEVCFLEAVIRDLRDGIVGNLPLAEEEITRRRYAEIETVKPLRLVDLRGSHAIAMGVPSDVHRSASQTLARLWSVEFHNHPQKPDGIIYPSRLNGHTNLAIYSRAIAKLRKVKIREVIAVPDLAPVLDRLQVALI